jgi:hypothetical protein
MARFSIRSPIRDRWKDFLRMQKLLVSLENMTGELEKEKTGLQKRYEAASADAAFSMDALDAGSTARDLSNRVDGLSDTLVRYSRRITELDAQTAFVAELQHRVEAFVAERGIDTAPAD